MFESYADGPPKAVPVIQIDRLLADCAAARCCEFQRAFKPTTLPFGGDGAQGATQIKVRSFACYRDGETPSPMVRHRPKGGLEKLLRGVSSECGTVPIKRFGLQPSPCTTKAHKPRCVDIPRTVKFSLVSTALTCACAHRRNAHVSPSDLRLLVLQALMTRGKPLTVDKISSIANGEVFPITGTTYMALRRSSPFSFRTESWVWYQDFQAMTGVNMVRTAFGPVEEIHDAGRQVDEGVLRGVRCVSDRGINDIPVIFTFFAFLPETWGGLNAYLDRRAVRAQQDFIAAFTRRCARERRDLGLHQRALVLLAETSLELPAQLRPIRKSRVATMADKRYPHRVSRNG